MTKQHLNVEFEVKNFGVKQVDDEDKPKVYEFEGYASTFGNVDLGRDIVMPGAFSDAVASQKQIPMLWQHGTYEPIGVFTGLREDNKGLFVRGQMPVNDTMVAGRVRPQMEIGSIRQMSIGYRTNKSEIDEEANVRRLIDIELLEISLVTFPMNPEAEITSVKAGDLESLLGLTPRELENVLRNGVQFSAKAAKQLISLVGPDLKNDERLRDAGDSIDRTRDVSDSLRDAESKQHAGLDAKLDALLAALKNGK